MGGDSLRLNVDMRQIPFLVQLSIVVMLPKDFTQADVQSQFDALKISSHKVDQSKGTFEDGYKTYVHFETLDKVDNLLELIPIFGYQIADSSGENVMGDVTHGYDSFDVLDQTLAERLLKELDPSGERGFALQPITIEDIDEPQIHLVGDVVVAMDRAVELAQLMGGSDISSDNDNHYGEVCFEMSDGRWVAKVKPSLKANEYRITFEED